MEEYRFTYLTLALLFCAAWALLYALDTSVRRKMIINSAIWAWFGPLADLLYTQDWWSPLTITGTAVGVEALLAAAGLAGVAVALPSVLLGWRSMQTPREWHMPVLTARLAVLLASSTGLFFGGFYLLGLNSLEATVAALGIPLGFLLLRRRDLVVPSLVSGIALAAASAAIYSVVSAVTPGWIPAFYHFTNVPAVVIGSLPLDDLLLYLVAGAYLGSYWEWWLGARYVAGP